MQRKDDIKSKDNINLGKQEVDFISDFVSDLPKEKSYDEITANLKQGPRNKQAPTYDLENIVAELLDSTKEIVCRFNAKGELEIKINTQLYNLTQLLQSKPYFEQLDIDKNDIYKYKKFLKSANNKPKIEGILGMPSREDYKKVDKKGLFNHLEYGEKLAITLATTEFYKKINPFLRHHGKVLELTKLGAKELTQEVKEILLASTIAAHGLAKPFPSKTLTEEEKQYNLNRVSEENRDRFVEEESQKIIRTRKLYRTEDSSQMQVFNNERLNAIKDNNPTLHEAFTSTAKFELSGSDTTVIIRQPVNANVIGKDVENLSNFKKEQEVLFPPGAEFLYYEHYQNPEQRQFFEAVAVRPTEDIDPQLYLSIRNQWHKQSLEELLHNLSSQLMKILSQASPTRVGIFSKPRELDHALQQDIQNIISDLASMQKKLKETTNVIEITNLLIPLKEQLQRLIHQNESLKTASLSKESKQLLINGLRNVVEFTCNAMLDAELLTHVNFVFKNYLEKAYTESYMYKADVNLKVHGCTIQRPNHGLAHTIRIANYLPAVIHFFSQHAKNAEFKAYCSSLTEGQQKMLQWVSLFLVSGRQSDLGFSDSKDLYRKYKRLSSENFIDYAVSLGMNEQEIKRYAELIKHLNDPAFIKAQQADANPETSFIYHILSFAHNLDLMRCKKPSEYEQAIAKATEHLLEDSLDVQLALNGLLQLANDMILATGDRMRTAFEHGKVISVKKPYDKDLFYKMSTEPDKCLITCSKVLTVSSVFTFNQKVNSAIIHFKP